MSPIKDFNEHDKGPGSHPTPAGESLLVRQRLHNLCQLAIEIGQREGLLRNVKNTNPNATNQKESKIAKLHIHQTQE
jgi:hypothetical protein